MNSLSMANSANLRRTSGVSWNWIRLKVRLQTFIIEAQKIIGPGVPVGTGTLDSLSQRLSAYQMKANRLKSHATNVAEISKEVSLAKRRIHK